MPVNYEKKVGGFPWASISGLLSVPRDKAIQRRPRHPSQILDRQRHPNEGKVGPYRAGTFSPGSGGNNTTLHLYWSENFAGLSPKYECHDWGCIAS